MLMREASEVENKEKDCEREGGDVRVEYRKKTRGGASAQRVGGIVSTERRIKLGLQRRDGFIYM